LIRKDGSRFLGEISASLLQAADGEPLGFIGITRDITERKIIEEELRESLERFQGLSEAAFDGIAIHDEGIIISANQALVDMFGYDPTELIGMNGIEFAAPEYRDVIRANIASGYEEPYEVIGIRKDGSTFPVELVGKACHYQGKAVRVAAFKDLTERKKTEEALEQSERYHRSLIRNAPDMITICNDDNTIRWGSPSTGRVTGYTAEEAYGRHILDFIHPDDAQIVQDALDFVKEHPGVLQSQEARFRHKDGTYHYHASTQINLIDDPYVKGIVVNSRDITERKQAQHRLEKLNQCFLSLGADPLSNMIKLTLTGKDMLEADLVLYGRRDKEGFSIFSSLHENQGFISPEKSEKTLCHHVISANKYVILSAQDLEGGILKNDPEVKELGLKSCIAYPVTSKGESVGCLCVLDKARRDFTQGEIDILAMLGKAIGVEEERSTNEEELKDFIDIASHELRHPITIMKGYANTLHEIDDRAGVMIRKEVLRAIDKGADRLNKLVLELMEVSRIERGRLTLAKKKRRLKPLIEKASKEMKAKGIENKFNLSVSEKLGRQAVDEDKFIETMVILLDNAAEFSPEGSDVDVIAEPGDEGKARISILDRGSGIPEEEREKVFERFYQAEETLHHSTGIGLGLYIAREIVEAHGGRIWCEPREGGGSIFRFTIP
jgi:PAS domain S-box-containing protein